MAYVRKEFGYRWDDKTAASEWGPGARNPCYVEFVEELIRAGALYVAFDHILYPGLFYNFTTTTIPDLEPFVECPERIGAPTDAEVRYLVRLWLRRAADAEVVVTEHGFHLGLSDEDLDAEDVVAIIRGLPLTAEVAAGLIRLIGGSDRLRGQKRPNLELELAVVKALERNPRASNRQLAPRVKASETTVRRIRERLARKE